jgi:hypothetical protein
LVLLNTTPFGFKLLMLLTFCATLDHSSYLKYQFKYGKYKLYFNIFSNKTNITQYMLLIKIRQIIKHSLKNQRQQQLKLNSEGVVY